MSEENLHFDGQIENMFSVFLLSYRNTHESLGNSKKLQLDRNTENIFCTQCTVLLIKQLLINFVIKMSQIKEILK